MSVSNIEKNKPGLIKKQANFWDQTHNLNISRHVSSITNYATGVVVDEVLTLMGTTINKFA